MAEPVLRFEGVTLRRGRRPVLEGVTFAVRPGESWALVGRNGAGKSTLLLAALGTLQPLRGTVSRAPGLDDRSEVGFVPQRCTLDPTLPTTVAEFVDGLAAAWRKFPEAIWRGNERVCQSVSHLPDAAPVRLRGRSRRRPGI